MNNIQLDHCDHVLSLKKYPLSFLANDIDRPINIGSIFRIADALGVEKIYLSGSSVVPPNQKISKSSRATEKYVPFTYVNDAVGTLNELKSSGYKIISLEITSKCIEISNMPVNEGDKICLILGGENNGVSQQLLDMSDMVICIPMLGANSSMNVAMACTIAAYEITRKMEQNAER